MPPATLLILDVCGEYSLFNKLFKPILNSNLLLDRKTIIGSLENPELGFFNDLINMES